VGFVAIPLFFSKHTNKAYGKAENGNEMEMKTKTHQSLVQRFLHRLTSNVLCHYSCIPLAMVIYGWVYEPGALPVLCFVFT